jgi:hypothetical protein
VTVKVNVDPPTLLAFRAVNRHVTDGLPGEPTVSVFVIVTVPSGDRFEEPTVEKEPLPICFSSKTVEIAKELDRTVTFKVAVPSPPPSGPVAPPDTVARLSGAAATDSDGSSAIGDHSDPSSSELNAR